jgi:hypothetical protein
MKSITREALDEIEALGGVVDSVRRGTPTIRRAFWPPMPVGRGGS